MRRPPAPHFPQLTPRGPRGSPLPRASVEQVRPGTHVLSPAVFARPGLSGSWGRASASFRRSLLSGWRGPGAWEGQRARKLSDREPWQETRGCQDRGWLLAWGVREACDGRGLACQNCQARGEWGPGHPASDTRTGRIQFHLCRLQVYLRVTVLLFLSVLGLTEGSASVCQTKTESGQGVGSRIPTVVPAHPSIDGGKERAHQRIV